MAFRRRKRRSRYNARRLARPRRMKRRNRPLRIGLRF